MLKPSKPKLDLRSVDYKDTMKKVAFFAVFGVTGIAAVAAYRYAKKKLDFDIDNIDWGL
jgi:hypothetical protein